MSRPLVLTALSLTLLSGCGEVLDKIGNDESDAFAQDGVDSVALTQAEAALVAAVVDGIPLADGDTAAMAAHAQSVAETTFTPADCVQAVATQSTVTYTFDTCEGPGDLMGLTGVVSTTFSVPGSESVTVSMTSSDLGVDGVFGTVNVTGTYSGAGDLPLLALQTSGAATTADGDLLGRLGTYTATLDGDCLELDGEWTTSVNDAVFFLTAVGDYRDCAGACPETGTLSYAELEDVSDMEGSPTGEVIVVSYAGDDTVLYVGFDGTPGSLALECP